MDGAHMQTGQSCATILEGRKVKNLKMTQRNPCLFFFACVYLLFSSGKFLLALAMSAPMFCPSLAAAQKARLKCKVYGL